MSIWESSREANRSLRYSSRSKTYGEELRELLGIYEISS